MREERSSFEARRVDPSLKVSSPPRNRILTSVTPARSRTGKRSRRLCARRHERLREHGIAHEVEVQAAREDDSRAKSLLEDVSVPRFHEV